MGKVIKFTGTTANIKNLQLQNSINFEDDERLKLPQLFEFCTWEYEGFWNICGLVYSSEHRSYSQFRGSAKSKEGAKLIYLESIPDVRVVCDD